MELRFTANMRLAFIGLSTILACLFIGIRVLGMNQYTYDIDSLVYMGHTLRFWKVRQQTHQFRQLMSCACEFVKACNGRKNGDPCCNGMPRQTIFQNFLKSFVKKKRLGMEKEAIMDMSLRIQLQKWYANILFLCMIFQH
jgi:hypothetical protein